MLLATEGEFWLIDPVFSERASPVQWMGPKRFHPVPVEYDQLPDIKGVIISHDHYDHLDQATIEQLSHMAEHFVTPLGVGQLMLDWGVEPQQIHELDWWQHVNIGKLKLTAAPDSTFPAGASPAVIKPCGRHGPLKPRTRISFTAVIPATLKALKRSVKNLVRLI